MVSCEGRGNLPLPYFCQILPTQRFLSKGMTMQDSLDSLSPLLFEIVSQYDIALSEQQIMLMVRHLELVLEKNESINLTRITKPRDALVLHILDSLLFSRAIPLAEDEAFRLLDMGTGAGYPGIPLGILYSNASCDLADSVGKKCQAVSEFVDELGLSSRIHVLCDRVESIANSQRASYDVVTARAMDKLSVLLEYASPLLKQHGVLVASKGRIQNDEFRHAINIAPKLGFEISNQLSFELPKGLGSREILCFEKVTKSKIHLPRSIGAAKHRPL